MADQHQQIPSAPFPAPPPFWKHFTSDNLSRLKALKDANTKVEDIPLELSYLEPPPTPQESYTIFGEEQTLSTTLPSLSSLGITQLYPSESTDPNHHQLYLLRILRSLHLNFQELNLILSRNPGLVGPKLEDMKNLFQNAHWLINMYRPHQARESLIAMMEEQIEEGRREMEECDRVGGRVDEVLKEIERDGGRSRWGDGPDDCNHAGKEGDSGNGTANASAEDEYAKRFWKMMTNIDVEAD